MIELFKTDVKHKTGKNQVLTAIKAELPGVVATLELDDSEKILRVVGAWAPVPIHRIIELVKSQGFNCELLHD